MAVLSNILDPVHDTLDPTVWDAVNESHPVLKQQHREWILSTLHDLLKQHGYGDSDKWLETYLTGSLTTFQYSDESDCDVSLFVNSEVFPEWSRAELIALMIDKVDGTELPGTTHPMQVFVVAEGIRPDDLYKPGLRSGYQIALDRWIVPPDHHRIHDVAREQNADYQYALEQADKMDRLLRYEPDKAVKFWHQIHSRRRRDHALGKGDYSQSNIIYKFLSNRGLFPKLEEATGEYIAKISGAYFNDDAPSEKHDPDDPFYQMLERERQERLKVRALPDVMYHVAPVERRQAILEHGLLPDAERINNESNHPPGVYLWDDPEVAMRYRGQGPNMYRDMDIHAVQVPRAGIAEDPWFYENHQDRAKDFPGAYYSPEAIAADRIHKFYDSPWHKRGSEEKTAAFFPHPNKVELARARLNLEHPVRFMPTYRGYRGGYAGLTRDPTTGGQSHLIFFNPNQHPGAKNWAVWHELAHAKQWEEGGPFVPTSYMSDEEYAQHPPELEAEAIAEQHSDIDLFEHPHKTASEKPRVLYNKFTPSNPHPPTDANRTATLPFIYDPADDIVHLGPANSFHWELIQRTPELRTQYPMDKAYQEFSALSVPTHLHGRLEWPAKHTDFMGLTSDNAHHRDAINAALGATTKPDENETWHDVFAKTNTKGLHDQEAEHTGTTSSTPVWSVH